MRTKVHENVDVLARTVLGQIDPVLVSWKGKNYTVKKVESRKKAKIRGNRIETIAVSVSVPKEMLLEFDHNRKLWRLLDVAQ